MYFLLRSEVETIDIKKGYYKKEFIILSVIYHSLKNWLLIIFT